MAHERRTAPGTRTHVVTADMGGRVPGTNFGAATHLPLGAAPAISAGSANCSERTMTIRS